MGSIREDAENLPDERSELDKEMDGKELDERIRILRKHNSRLQKKLDDRETGWELIRGVLEDIYDEKLHISLSKPPKQKRGKNVETAVLHLTDVHFGKKTPTYNITHAQERMRIAIDGVRRVLRVRRSSASISHLELLLGGDMVEGEGSIFPGQAHEIDIDLMAQMVKEGPECIASLILSLSEDFETMHIPGVPGNHGSDRTGKGSKRNNQDSVFYEIVRHIVQKHDVKCKITWDLPLDRKHGHEWWAHTYVGRWGLLLVHGDQIRGQLGLPWYGVNKKALGWSDVIPKSWDYMFAGHFHTAANFDINRRTMMFTGSPESDNPYAAESMAAAGIPKQRIGFFNDEFGLIADIPLYLTERHPNR